jgi:Ca-activated chloride channel family protein
MSFPTSLRRRSRPLSTALVAGLVLAASGPLPAQAPPRPTPAPTPPGLTFGTGIEIVNLNVSVTDNRNRYITGLDEQAFAVYEDGVRQDLSLFTHENLPISMVLLIDTSASMDEKLPQAQAAAVRFIGTLRAQDIAQVIQFNDRITVLQDFTADHAALEAAIGKLRASGPTSLHNALYVALKELIKDKEASARQLRRRAIVLLSDGEDTASLVSDEQVIELARKAELGIYAISLRPNRSQDRSRLSFSQAAYLLSTLARESGGQVHFPNSLSELDSVYDRIAEELRTQYNLGYVSSNGRRDGKWRRIVVRVDGRDDLQVRHKIGYYAPS